MKTILLLSLMALAGCAGAPTMNSTPRLDPAYESPLTPARPQAYSDLARPDIQEVRLFDSNTLRAIRRASDDELTLSLTREQKIAIWVGVAIVGAYLIADWIEDEVAFLP